MGLREILLAGVISFNSAMALAQEAPTEKPTRGSLALKYGTCWQDGIWFKESRASIGIERYFFELGVREEMWEREQQDNLSVASINLKGKRTFLTYQVNFMFGYAIYELNRPAFEMGLYGHVMSTIQVDKNLIEVEGENIPGDPHFKFTLGAGLRMEISHPLSYWTNWPFVRNLKLGLALFGDYLRYKDENITEPESGTFVGSYGLVRIAGRVR